jgi:hypothetical protein
MRKVNMRNLSALLLFSLMVFCPRAEFAQSATAAVAPTEISADLGACSALVTVTGADSKPVYNAKVTTRIHYGFMGTKKLDLETYTSAAGQVKIVKLPEAPKKPVLIYISKDDKTESVEFKPDEHCRATFDVQLK